MKPPGSACAFRIAHCDRPVGHRVKQHHVCFGRSGTCRLRNMQTRFDLYSAKAHDAPLVLVPKTSRGTSALIATLRVLVQSLDVIVRAKVGDQERGACRSVGLVTCVGITEGLAFAAIAFPESAECHSRALLTTREILASVFDGRLGASLASNDSQRFAAIDSMEATNDPSGVREILTVVERAVYAFLEETFALSPTSNGA